MARPRTPATILEMRGSFEKDPQRARIDAEGAGEFDKTPPTHLPQECVRAWNYIAERIPKIAVYNCDEVTVEMSARLLSQVWAGNLDKLPELRQWLGKLGFSPVDRAKLAVDANKKPQNKFGQLKSS